MERNGLLPTLLLTTQNASSIGEPIDYGVCREMLQKSIGNTWYKDILYLAFFNTIQNEIDTPSGITHRLYKRELRNQAIVVMHLSILIPGGKGAGNGWGFDKKFKNWVKCPVGGILR